jgi:heat shock protein HtpX
MATLYTHKTQNIAKTWFLMLTFAIVVLGLGWAVSWYFGNPFILYGVVAFVIIMQIWSYWFSHKTVIKTSGAQPMPDEGRYAEVHNMVENLAITAGLPKPDLYYIQDDAPNAFATGRNPEHAVIAVTTGLMDRLNRTELEGVLAHELSHIGNRDMLVSTVAVVLLGFVSLIADMILHSMLFGFVGGDNRNPWVAAVGLVVALLAPLIAQLIQLAISRRREFLADASGALLTRYPDGLASALQKIGSYNQPMQRANDATAHLFIANPFGGEGLKDRIHKLFMTHPPIEDRVKALRQQGQE